MAKDKKDAEKRAHAVLSPSSASRWLRCTPSAVAESKVTDQGSVYAAEGTLAHALCAEELLRRMGRPVDDVEKEIADLCKIQGEPDEYMVTCAQEYAEHVWGSYLDLLEADEDTEIHVETPLDLDSYAPGSFGTADAVVVGRDVLHIFDFKYGKGVEVSAVGNPQMRLYALGALDEFGISRSIKTVCMTIWQPRIGNVSTDEITVEELDSWADTYLKPLAAVAALGLGAREAGSHCRFCKVSSGCPALDRVALAASLYDVDSSDPDGLARTALPLVEPLSLWIENVKSRAMAWLLEGTKVPGYKVVNGRSTRKVSDPVKLRTALIEAGWDDDAVMKPRELQTITALEKLVGKKKFAELSAECVVKAPGKPTVVPDTDKRQTYQDINPFAEIEF